MANIHDYPQPGTIPGEREAERDREMAREFVDRVDDALTALLDGSDRFTGPEMERAHALVERFRDNLPEV